jgi:plasmid stabilization system protein ParE
MAYPIRYSIRAYNEYESILEYVSGKFGIAKAVEIDIYFENVIEMIAINPYMFPFSSKKGNLRRCVISPQTTLYYRFLGESIELVSFRGNKMKPETLGL